MLLFWSAWLGLLIVILFWLWGWRGLIANPAWAATTFGPLLLVLPFALLLRRFTVRRHWRNNKALQKPFGGREAERVRVE